METREGTKKISREAQRQRRLQKEAVLDLALQSAAGLAKIAASLANPVRKNLDYVGIGRQTAVVEPIASGQISYFDRDIEEFTATKIANNGTTSIIEIEVARVFVDGFSIVCRPKIPVPRLYTTKYDVMARTGERLLQSAALREDLYLFSLYNTQSTVANTAVTCPTMLSKHGLALAYREIERRRNKVKNVVMSPYGPTGIRRWEFKDLDEATRAAVIKTGYMGSLWGADLFVSDQMTSNTVFLLAEPQMCAWIPIYKDFDVTPADDPNNQLLGFVGMEYLGMVAHNSWGVAKLTFDITV